MVPVKLNVVTLDLNICKTNHNFMQQHLLAKKGPHVLHTSPFMNLYSRATVNIQHKIREAFLNSFKGPIKDKRWKEALHTPLPDWSRRTAVTCSNVASFDMM